MICRQKMQSDLCFGGLYNHRRRPCRWKAFSSLIGQCARPTEAVALGVGSKLHPVSISACA